MTTLKRPSTNCPTPQDRLTDFRYFPLKASQWVWVGEQGLLWIKTQSSLFIFILTRNPTPQLPASHCFDLPVRLVERPHIKPLLICPDMLKEERSAAAPSTGTNTKPAALLWLDEKLHANTPAAAHAPQSSAVEAYLRRKT